MTTPQPPPPPPPLPHSQTASNSGVDKRVIVIAIAVLAMVGVAAFFATRGTTRATSLEIGGCYEAPTDQEGTSRLTNQDCALPHDLQVYGEASRTLITYPGLSDVSEIDLPEELADDSVREDLLEAFREPVTIETNAVPSFDEASAMCDDQFEALDLDELDPNFVTVPADTGFSILEVFNDSGETKKFWCIIDSPSGQLVGTLIPD